MNELNLAATLTNCLNLKMYLYFFDSTVVKNTYGMYVKKQLQIISDNNVFFF